MGITQNQIAVVLLGRPGSGKGTQAQLLAASGWRHVNVGGLVRSRVAAQTAWGKRASQFMLRGELLPSQVIQELLANELICGKFPVVIEGYPRRLEEAGTVSEMCGSGTQEIPIYIDVSISVSIARLNARLVCQVCGSVDRIGVRVTCAYCGGTLTSRADDLSETAIARRMELFELETIPLVDYYKSRGSLINISSEGKELDVHKELMEKISAQASTAKVHPEPDDRRNLL